MKVEVIIPKYKGKYCLGGELGFCISLVKKPNIIKRYFMKILLGWEWIDNQVKIKEVCTQK